MKKLLLSISIFIFLLNFSSKAAWGDTTVVQSHNNSQLTWWGYTDNWVNFPTNSKQYQKIEMEFILGCGGSRCSHWDYDVDVEIGKPMGVLDSTVANLDTVSTNPLIVDTTWNVFEVIEWYEVARLITPYANYMDWGQNGFNNNWTRAFYFDVTDYEPLMRDSIPIRVHYHGWDAPRGFSSTVNFKFIEGKPARKVVGIDRDVFTGGTYTNFNQFDNEFMPAKTLTLPQGANAAKLNFIITGHGQTGEFTPIEYTFKANGNDIVTKNLWRENCDSAVTFPQAGTWIISRCNWCPGEPVETYQHELTPFILNNQVTIDIDLTNFSPPNAASYQVAAHVIYYADYIREYDVELSNIIAPNSDNNFNRFNPLCSQPIIEVKNQGKQVINSFLIEYGVVGGQSFWHEWNGNLQHLGATKITLPSLNWNGADVSNPEFFAKISRPNKLVDQNPHNNEKKVSFDLVDNFNITSGNGLTIRFRSNNFPQENTLYLRDKNGNLIFTKNNYPANVVNDTILFLNDGCYHFSVHDYGTDVDAGDGFQWAFSGQFGLTENTAGQIQFRNGTTTLKTLPKDFGAHYEYSFTINQSQLSDNGILAGSMPVMPTVNTVQFEGQTYYQIYDTVFITEDKVVISYSPLSIFDLEETEKFLIYPNPSNGTFSVLLSKNADVEIVNVSGQKVYSNKFNKGEHFITLNQPNGVYFVTFKNKGKQISTSKLVIN